MCAAEARAGTAQVAATRRAAAAKRQVQDQAGTTASGRSEAEAEGEVEVEGEGEAAAQQDRTQDKEAKRQTSPSEERTFTLAECQRMVQHRLLLAKIPLRVAGHTALSIRTK